MSILSSKFFVSVAFFLVLGSGLSAYAQQPAASSTPVRTPKPPLELVVTKSFPEVVGGQQGIATDGKHVYMQATSQLAKYDLDGKLLAKSAQLTPHHGGITYKDGKIYAAVSECRKEGTEVHAVYVYDAETLERVGEYDLHEYFDTCAGGIAYCDHHFYVAESYFDNEHPDYIVKFDEDFKYVESYKPDFKSPFGIQGLDYLPELGKFIINSHGKAFYLISPDFDNATIEVGEADFQLQDVAHLNAATVVVNDRAGKRLCLAQLEGTAAVSEKGNTMNDYTVACYYFPNYHPSDARNAKVHGEGWSEWEVVKKAPVRFEGHRQPLLPAWGYTDESDPKQMAQKIAAASDNGIDAWIFDWYYYDDGPFLERGLEKGFFGAPNNNRIKFGLMWANHDWLDMHPRKVGVEPAMLYPGRITPETFDRMTDYIIQTYFVHPSYWMVDGAPYFSIYEIWKLVEGFGSLEATKDALAQFRAKTKAAGFPDLHLNAVFWGRSVLPGEKVIENPETVIPELGFDSVTSYVWVHHVPLDQRPYTPYLGVLDKYLAYARATAERFSIPYFPNVSMGWDNTPRSDAVQWGNIMGGNTPENFRKALADVKAALDQTAKGPRILNINAWNEWTEGSYLEPDTVNGYAYLEAVKAVFGANAHANE